MSQFIVQRPNNASSNAANMKQWVSGLFAVSKHGPWC